jgi:hypothetical protein
LFFFTDSELRDARLPRGDATSANEIETTKEHGELGAV